MAQVKGTSPAPARTERLPALSSQANPAGWRYLVGPVLLFTALAGVSILFIGSCAREAELDLQVRVARAQVERLRAENQSLCSRINEARDPAALRRLAVTGGMVFTPAGIDRITVPRALPPAHVELSPLAELPLPPEASPAPYAPETLAHAPSPAPR